MSLILYPDSALTFFFFLSFRQGFIIYPWLALELTKILLPVSQVLVLIKDYRHPAHELVTTGPFSPFFLHLEPAPRLCLDCSVSPSRVLGLKTQSAPESQSKFLLVLTLVFACPKDWTICLLSNRAFHLQMLSTSSLSRLKWSCPLSTKDLCCDFMTNV